MSGTEDSDPDSDITSEESEEDLKQAPKNTAEEKEGQNQDEEEGEGDIQDFPDSDFVDIFINDIQLDSQAFDIDFHPFRPLISVAQLTGEVALWNFSSKGNTKEKALTHHSGSVRAVSFSQDGKMLYTGSVDKSLGLVDVETMKASVISTERPVNVVKVYDEHTVVSGHDDGEVKIWDARESRNHKLNLSWEEAEHGDYVTDMCAVPAKQTLLVTSGDGTLSVYDMRKRQIPFMSEVLHDDMTSVILQKNGRKHQVVCGTREGILNIFNYGMFGVPADRFVGHPSSVDCLVAMNDHMFCSGSSDGLIRILQLRATKGASNKFIGVVGHHEGMPVECLKLCPPLRESKVPEDSVHLLGSVSHDNVIKFWDVEYLYEEDDEKQDDDSDGAISGDLDDDEDEEGDDDDEGDDLAETDTGEPSSCSSGGSSGSCSTSGSSGSSSTSGSGGSGSSGGCSCSSCSGSSSSCSSNCSSSSSGSSSCSSSDCSSSSSSSGNSSSNSSGASGLSSNGQSESKKATGTKKRRKDSSSEVVLDTKKSLAERTLAGIDIQRKSKALFKQSTSGFFDGL